jgi:hypothetical protein
VSQLQWWMILFVCLLSLTVYCSCIGDDDVVYRYLNRSPTPHEAIIPLRWVILRTFTSIYGGILLATIPIEFMSKRYPIRLSGDGAVVLALVCMGLVSVSIGILQNGIRRLRGRPTRPLIDGVVWRRSSGPWGGRQ